MKQNSDGLVLASCPPSFSFPRKYECCSMASSTYSKSFLYVIKRTGTSAPTRPTSLLPTPLKADRNAAPSSPQFSRSHSSSQKDPGVIPAEQRRSSEPCPAPGEGRRPLSLLSSRSHRGVPVRSRLLCWSSDFPRAPGDSSRHSGERQGTRERREKGRKERLFPVPRHEVRGSCPPPAAGRALSDPHTLHSLPAGAAPTTSSRGRAPPRDSPGQAAPSAPRRRSTRKVPF